MELETSDNELSLNIKFKPKTIHYWCRIGVQNRSSAESPINPAQGCQYHFDRYFVFLIGTKCFDFRAFQRVISRLYFSSIYIQNKLIINYIL
jgi:hypothetical protein